MDLVDAVHALRHPEREPGCFWCRRVETRAESMEFIRFWSDTIHEFRRRHVALHGDDPA